MLILIISILGIIIGIIGIYFICEVPQESPKSFSEESMMLLEKSVELPDPITESVQDSLLEPIPEPIPNNGLHRSWRNGFLYITDYKNGRKNGNEQKYKDFNLVMSCNYIHNKLHGPCTHYSKNERIECNYFHGALDGLYEKYNNDSVKIFEEHYLNGLLHGTQLGWENGQLKHSTKYIDGIKHGPYMASYYDMKEEGQYKNGKQHGTWITTLPNGKIIRERYKNGVKNKFYYF